MASNVGCFSGFADLLATHRAPPPDRLGSVLTSYAGVGRPRVVDLGSGTASSTRWAATWAGSVVGVEPNPAMRAVADPRGIDSVRHVAGYGHDTGLAGGSTGVVVVVQAMHWMRPARGSPKSPASCDGPASRPSSTPTGHR